MAHWTVYFYKKKPDSKRGGGGGLVNSSSPLICKDIVKATDPLE